MTCCGWTDLSGVISVTWCPCFQPRYQSRSQRHGESPSEAWLSDRRPEYSTWAGMIVTQYGRIPGDHNRAGTALAFPPEDQPKHSAALDQLQRYYGTGDSSSEPGNFRPGVLKASSWIAAPPVHLCKLEPSKQTPDSPESCQRQSSSHSIRVESLTRVIMVSGYTTSMRGQWGCL